MFFVNFLFCVSGEKISYYLWYLLVFIHQEKSLSILHERLWWNRVKVVIEQSWELSNPSWLEQLVKQELIESNNYLCRT